MRFALALACILLIDARVADACSLAGNGQHALDQAHANDTVAPGAVTASEPMIYRSEDDGDGFGCQRVAGCGSYGVIMFSADATDNATPADRIGLQLRVVRGTPPRGLHIPDEAITTFGDDAYLYFDHDAPDFDFDLEIRAVDLNGNLGPPTVLTLEQHAEGGGCATSGRHAATWGFALAALALVTLRRRRRHC